MGFLGLFSRHKPKIKISSSKKDGFSGWMKCTVCQEMVHANQLESNWHCCPKCDHHYRLNVDERIKLLCDEGSFKPEWEDLESNDSLRFVDTEAYTERLKRAQKKSGRKDGVVVGLATMESIKVAIGVLDFSFMGGSMGAVVGEKLTRLIELAIKERVPVIIVSASGGARMQESTLSLMQMAKTSAALAKLGEEGLPYISLLTNPTTGGVTASFASLGDLMIAEPDALIGFAGPRVVEQTIKQKLPETAQKSEFLLEKGMIDGIIRRPLLKKTLVNFLQYLTPSPQKLDILMAELQKSRKKNAIEVVSKEGK
jgi:acetyl-CoA carboxylase carboxyl transferase subunit beta